MPLVSLQIVTSGDAGTPLWMSVSKHISPGVSLLTSRQDLVSRLTPDNARINNGVLQVAHSIFKRWRPLYRSDELYTEINHVLSKFGEPFVQLLGVRLCSQGSEDG